MTVITQSVRDTYYEVWQILQTAADITICDTKLLQSVIGIKKCDKKLLQSVTVYTKCDR